MQAKVQVKWRKQVYEIEVALDRPVLALKTQVEPLVPLSPVYAPVVGRKAGSERLGSVSLARAGTVSYVSLLTCWGDPARAKCLLALLQSRSSRAYDGSLRSERECIQAGKKSLQARGPSGYTI
jgi:hypothetical protein